ncbi:MAG: gamma-glutamyltransferase, partial [Bauldia sp.]|nr:gamma-glutamyltransferase [Bauldia sp.]
MSETVVGEKGMVTAPHRAAAEAGGEVLKAGGNAIEAMIAAAATIAVVYPHLN